MTFHDDNVAIAPFLSPSISYWYRLENYCRGLGKRYDEVRVISGPLFLPVKEGDRKLVNYPVNIDMHAFITFYFRYKINSSYMYFVYSILFFLIIGGIR